MSFMMSVINAETFSSCAAKSCYAIAMCRSRRNPLSNYVTEGVPA
jgi:hypothetical protein